MRSYQKNCYLLVQLYLTNLITDEEGPTRKPIGKGSLLWLFAGKNSVFWKFAGIFNKYRVEKINLITKAKYFICTVHCIIENGWNFMNPFVDWLCFLICFFWTIILQPVFFSKKLNPKFQFSTNNMSKIGVCARL